MDFNSEERELTLIKSNRTSPFTNIMGRFPKVKIIIYCEDSSKIAFIMLQEVGMDGSVSMHFNTLGRSVIVIVLL